MADLIDRYIELREFYKFVLDKYPHIIMEYDKIVKDNEELFKRFSDECNNI